MCLMEGAECVYSAPEPRQSTAADAVPSAPEPEDADMANIEPDDLVSPGFHTAPSSLPDHAPAAEAIDHSLDGTTQQPTHGHFGGHEPVAESIPHQLESPSDTFSQAHGIYQHPSGLSFPQIATTTASDTAQFGLTSATMESTRTGYMQNSVPETSEAPLHGYTYPQPPTTQKAASDYIYAEQTTPAVTQSQRSSAGASRSAARRSLPTGQPSHGSGTAGISMSAQTSNWQSLSETTTPAAPATRTSPRQSRAKKACSSLTGV